ncbi:transposase IS4 family protein [Pandoraea sp. SD6-2]|nr:transposase IS4 family protein [Pandoraea sp. SD6-2]
MLSDNRQEPVANAQVTLAAHGTAERDAAIETLADAAPAVSTPIVVGAGKNHGKTGFVAAGRAHRITPHEARNHARRGASAIDGRTTRWPG